MKLRNQTPFVDMKSYSKGKNTITLIYRYEDLELKILEKPAGQPRVLLYVGSAMEREDVDMYVSQVLAPNKGLHWRNAVEYKLTKMRLEELGNE